MEGLTKKKCVNFSCDASIFVLTCSNSGSWGRTMTIVENGVIARVEAGRRGRIIIRGAIQQFVPGPYLWLDTHGRHPYLWTLLIVPTLLGLFTLYRVPCRIRLFLKFKIRADCDLYGNSCPNTMHIIRWKRRTLKNLWERYMEKLWLSLG